MSMHILPFAEIVVNDEDPIESILYSALVELIQFGGKRAQTGVLLILSSHVNNDEEPKIKDVVALLLCHMDIPVGLREPTATELLTRVIKYINTHKPDTTAATDKTSK